MPAEAMKTNKATEGLQTVRVNMTVEADVSQKPPSMYTEQPEPEAIATQQEPSTTSETSRQKNQNKR